MSFDKLTIDTLAKEFDCERDLAMFAFKKGGSITSARSWLNKWIMPTNNSKTEETKSQGCVSGFVNPMTGVGVIVEAYSIGEQKIEEKEFVNLTSFAAYKFSGGNDTTLPIEEIISKVEKKYESKIEIKTKSLQKSRPNSLLTVYNHENKISALVETTTSNIDIFSHILFKRFSYDCALHIAAFEPIAISRNKAPFDAISGLINQTEAELYSAGKDMYVWEKEIKERISGWLSRKVLLEQSSMQDTETFKDKIASLNRQLNTEIEVINFLRSEI